ncbi:MAG TPA: hypothetical protein VI911_10545 [Patescibacteria group bacterium]|nr:hypothetical protein [Patescibacteria group bacterium]
MTNMIVTCKCGRTLKLQSSYNWKIRYISVSCDCGLGLVINTEGSIEKIFDLSPTIRKSTNGKENNQEIQKDISDYKKTCNFGV